MAERRCCGALPQCRANQGGPITLDCRMCERSPTYWAIGVDPFKDAAPTTAEGSGPRCGAKYLDPNLVLDGRPGVVCYCQRPRLHAGEHGHTLANTAPVVSLDYILDESAVVPQALLTRLLALPQGERPVPEVERDHKTGETFLTVRARR